MEYTREELIKICEKAIVDVSKWQNRDTPSSQESVGRLWALLKSNCPFKILYDTHGLCTNEQTIWLEVYWPQFSHFDWVGFDLEDITTLHSESFYIPTLKRLEAYENNDWY